VVRQGKQKEHDREPQTAQPTIALMAIKPQIQQAAGELKTTGKKNIIKKTSAYQPTMTASIGNKKISTIADAGSAYSFGNHSIIDECIRMGVQLYPPAEGIQGISEPPLYAQTEVEIEITIKGKSRKIRLRLDKNHPYPLILGTDAIALFEIDILHSREWRMDGRRYPFMETDYRTERTLSAITVSNQNPRNPENKESGEEYGMETDNAEGGILSKPAKTPFERTFKSQEATSADGQHVGQIVKSNQIINGRTFSKSINQDEESIDHQTRPETHNRHREKLKKSDKKYARRMETEKSSLRPGQVENTKIAYIAKGKMSLTSETITSRPSRQNQDN
jgi:hypothetical protein